MAANWMIRERIVSTTGSPKLDYKTNWSSHYETQGMDDTQVKAEKILLQILLFGRNVEAYVACNMLSLVNASDFKRHATIDGRSFPIPNPYRSFNHKMTRTTNVHLLAPLQPPIYPPSPVMLSPHGTTHHERCLAACPRGVKAGVCAGAS
jgi:hypothetical protein